MKNGTMEQLVTTVKDKMKIASGSEKEVEVLSEKEIEKILFNVYDNVKVSARDKTIVLLLLYSGVRVGELVSIKIRNIDFLTSNLVVVGKGNKSREIPLKVEVIESIKEYMEGERTDNKYCDSEYLLLSQRSPMMSNDSINKLLNSLGTSLGIHLFPHKFRHSFYSMLIKKNVPIVTVS